LVHHIWLNCWIILLSFSPWFILSELETNECLERNGGCWQDKQFNTTACKARQKNSNLSFLIDSP
jgi:hypothetical protein